jgi:hypothetical protein
MLLVLRVASLASQIEHKILLLRFLFMKSLWLNVFVVYLVSDVLTCL